MTAPPAQVLENRIALAALDLASAAAALVLATAVPDALGGGRSPAEICAFVGWCTLVVPILFHAAGLYEDGALVRPTLPLRVAIATALCGASAAVVARWLLSARLDPHAHAVLAATLAGLLLLVRVGAAITLRRRAASADVVRLATLESFARSAPPNPRGVGAGRRGRAA
jgi:hypothetical protein